MDELGFEPVDAGSLENSWQQQPGTPCYAADFDARRLKESLAAADRGRLPEYRGKADADARAFFASQGRRAPGPPGAALKSYEM